MHATAANIIPQRDHGLICVVEGVSELWALERAHAHRGLPAHARLGDGRPRAVRHHALRIGGQQAYHSGNVEP